MEQVIYIDREDFKNVYFRLQNIPRANFSDCIEAIKNFHAKYLSEEKLWKINKNSLSRLENKIFDIIEGEDLLFEENDINNKKDLPDIIYFLNSQLLLLDNDNLALSLSNSLIKHLRLISIELNKKIYEGYK